MRILGIDPGTTLVGYGIIEENRNELTSITYGVLNIKQTTLAEKLFSLSKKLRALLIEYKPDRVGLEKLYFAKNKKTALEVAQARGVILLELTKAGIPIVELNPSAAKIAVTNYGLADKKMVAKIVQKILKIEKLLSDDNASDALAIAITASRATFQ